MRRIVKRYKKVTRYFKISYWYMRRILLVYEAYPISIRGVSYHCL